MWRKPIRKLGITIRHVKVFAKQYRSAGIAQAVMNNKLQVMAHRSCHHHEHPLHWRGPSIQFVIYMLNLTPKLTLICDTAALLCHHGVRALEQGGRPG